MRNIRLIVINFISILILFSCNSEKKERESRLKADSERQEALYEKMAKQYGTVPLTEELIEDKFSYELEQEYVNKNIACVVSILDVKKINDNDYQVFAKNGKLTFNITIDNEILNKILSIRSQQIANNDWHGSFFTDLVFVLKPNKILKNYGVYKSVSDFDIVEGEEMDDFYLDDYIIDLELDENGFMIKATGLNVMLADRIFYEFEEL